MTIKAANKYIHAHVPELTLCRGRGYLYFRTDSGTDIPDSIYGDAEFVTEFDLDVAIDTHLEMKAGRLGRGPYTGKLRI